MLVQYGCDVKGSRGKPGDSFCPFQGTTTLTADDSNASLGKRRQGRRIDDDRLPRFAGMEGFARGPPSTPGGMEQRRRRARRRHLAPDHVRPWAASFRGPPGSSGSVSVAGESTPLTGLAPKRPFCPASAAVSASRSFMIRLHACSVARSGAGLRGLIGRSLQRSLAIELAGHGDRRKAALCGPRAETGEKQGSSLPMRAQCWFSMVAVWFLHIRCQSNALAMSDQQLLNAPRLGFES